MSIGRKRWRSRISNPSSAVTPLLDPFDNTDALPIHRPVTAIEVGELIRSHPAIYPRGGGTHTHIGGLPAKPGIVLDLTAMNRIIDYPARDMTVTLQAGASLGQLGQLLQSENQWLPIDVPNPDAATVGGSMAVNANGPRRLAQGTWRDAVIGIRFVSDDGIESKGGGRVVKNVAGYDLMKLHTGALGTLGVITEVTLKVKPRPEASSFVVFGVPSSAVGPTLDRLHASISRPVALELLNRAAAKRLGVPLPDAEPWIIACGFEEKAATVAWQIAALKDESKGSPLRDLAVIEGEMAAKLWLALTELQAGGHDFSTLKFNTRPSAVAGLALRADAGDSRAVIHAHAGNGIVFVHVPNEAAPNRLSNLVADLLSDRREDNVQILRCPGAWKSRLPVWGRDRGDRKLMATVRAALDPRGIFNPGRVAW